MDHSMYYSSAGAGFGMSGQCDPYGAYRTLEQGQILIRWVRGQMMGNDYMDEGMVGYDGQQCQPGYGEFIGATTNCSFGPTVPVNPSRAFTETYMAGISNEPERHHETTTQRRMFRQRFADLANQMQPDEFMQAPPMPPRNFYENRHPDFCLSRAPEPDEEAGPDTTTTAVAAAGALHPAAQGGRLQLPNGGGHANGTRPPFRTAGPPFGGEQHARSIPHAGVRPPENALHAPLLHAAAGSGGGANVCAIHCACTAGPNGRLHPRQRRGRRRRKHRHPPGSESHAE